MESCEIQLVDFPNYPVGASDYWKVKAIAINGSVLILSDWSKLTGEAKEPQKHLMSSMKMAAQIPRVCVNKNCVRQNRNPDYGKVYEFKTRRSLHRLMFFYDHENKLIICTNLHTKKSSGKKRKSEQDNGFALCAEIKKLYQGNMK